MNRVYRGMFLGLAVMARSFAPALAVTPIDLGADRLTISEAIAVSDGTVVGNEYSESQLGVREFEQAFLWTPDGGKVFLCCSAERPNVHAVAMDDAQIVGWAHATWVTTHAFSWTQSGGMVDLGTLGGGNSQAMAVSRGRVAGFAGLPERKQPLSAGRRQVAWWILER